MISGPYRMHCAHVRRPPFLTAGLLVAAASCRRDVTTSPYTPAVAVVYGRVTDVAGVPRAGVLVTPLGYRAGCGAGEPAASGSPPNAVTDAAGAYRVVLNTPSPAGLCVVSQARGASGGVVLAQASAEAVPFRQLDIKVAGTRARDSVRVDIALP